MKWDRPFSINIVAAFRGMHVSPAKHGYSRLPRKCDYRTDRHTDRRLDAGQNNPYWYVLLYFTGNKKSMKVLSEYGFKIAILSTANEYNMKTTRTPSYFFIFFFQIMQILVNMYQYVSMSAKWNHSNIWMTEFVCMNFGLSNLGIIDYSICCKKSIRGTKVINEKLVIHPGQEASERICTNQ